MVRFCVFLGIYMWETIILLMIAGLDHGNDLIGMGGGSRSGSHGCACRPPFLPEGTGLGLYLELEDVSSLGGNLRTSNSGHGSDLGLSYSWTLLRVLDLAPGW